METTKPGAVAGLDSVFWLCQGHDTLALHPQQTPELRPLRTTVKQLTPHGSVHSLFSSIG